MEWFLVPTEEEEVHCILSHK